MGSTVRAVPRSELGSSEPLPMTSAELTTAWFSKALGHEVTAVHIQKEIHGTASKIMVEVEYANPSAAPPKHLCVKGGFNAALIAIHPAVLVTNRIETEFYYYIAPTVAMRLPTAYYCGTSTANGQGIVIMENLNDSNATYGSVLEPFPVDLVRKGVKELALLHAKTWGAKPEDFPWFAQTGNGLRESIESLWAPALWQERYFTDECPPKHPEVLKDRARVVAAFHTLWRTTDPRFRAMVHGDTHCANTFKTPAGEPGFIDWQCVHPNSAIHDVAYFITGSLTVEDRREHERGLYQVYLDELAAAGGPKFDIDDAWEEFRRQQLHGFVWSLTSRLMQPREVVDVFSERHGAAIVDHKSLEVLEAHPEHKPLEQ